MLLVGCWLLVALPQKSPTGIDGGYLQKCFGLLQTQVGLIITFTETERVYAEKRETNRC